MRLFGFDITKAPRTARAKQSPWQLRANDGQGPFTPYFRAFVPRKVEATFFEFMRESIPIVDAAINRLVQLDGHIEVKGHNDTLVDEIQDWLYNVPVNDLQRGVQAFHQGMGNEAFEQGFVLGEFIADKSRRDIVGLRVADSKFIKFRRVADGLEMYQKADGDHDWRLLKPDNLLYFSIGNENQNPYGTPTFRSCEFVTKVLTTIHNSQLNVWERFGDPSFSIIYKTSKKDGPDLSSRHKAITDEFNEAVRAKRAGHSADFVRAIDANSEIEIKVIGADGQVLELEIPARHVLEQIIAKSGLPAWMLGMHWSTTERLANYETEMLLADVGTRQAAKLPLFHNLIATLLRMRGRTWKKGDWWLEWGNVNLHDLEKQARARFLNAQADMYYLQNAQAAGITLSREDLSLGKQAGKELVVRHKGAGCGPDCGCKSIAGQKEIMRTLPWPALDALEDGYEKQLKSDWADLAAQVRLAAGFGMPKGAKAPEDEPFTLSVEQRSRILQALSDFVGTYVLDNPDSPVAWYYGQSFSLGAIQAAQLVGEERPAIETIRNSETLAKLSEEGFQRVKDNATKAIQDKILAEMEAHVLAGSNPLEVAARLEKLFDQQNSAWERLARSELSLAAENAKLEQWRAYGLKMVEFAPAPDACPLCVALAGDYEIAKVPLPVRDTHPRCRCATRPAADQA
ncbi:hypothetical protein [Geoalkalibacter sp.]|uniref:hypothetical protein n=1 Tax=Geoalkalibacter sp. TaxID=3041440 RepID=UPI00272EE21E|nr:hypothetical protein [Geoalkalibacter sp.]